MISYWVQSKTQSFTFILEVDCQWVRIVSDFKSANNIIVTYVTCTVIVHEDFVDSIIVDFNNQPVRTKRCKVMNTMWRPYLSHFLYFSSEVIKSRILDFRFTDCIVFIGLASRPIGTMVSDSDFLQAGEIVKNRIDDSF